MNEQIKVQEVLRQKFLELKQKNPAFSVRSFAKILNMQPSATNEIMKGERKVSIKMAKKIAEKLMLDPQQTADLLESFTTKKSNQVDIIQSRDVLRRNAHNFEFVTNWLYQSIIIILQTRKEISTDVLVKVFGVSEVNIKRVIGRLVEMGLISINENQTIISNGTMVDENIFNNQVAIKNMHLNDLELIKDKIQSGINDQMILESQTLLFNNSSIIKANEILKKAFEDLKSLESPARDEQVFRISTYLYPLSSPIIP